MKKSIFITALAAMFAFTSCKENAADKVNAENVEATAERNAHSGKFPVMSFDNKEHDFGVIEQGTHVEHLFTFTNTGDAPLVITDAKGSCGCTAPNFTREPVNPGERGEVLVKFNGSGQNQRNNTVTLTTNTASGTERLSIKAFVNPKEGATRTSSLSTNSSK